MAPISRHGKICYIEMPADDVARSSEFYSKVFGWQLRTRGNGAVAFDDGVEVSGTWVKGRMPHPATGLMIYIMVDSAAKTLEAIVANGGQIVQEIGKDLPAVTARFSDPAGNIIGIYQNG
jgi:predicted enzyme related to lactoylglutathione lyase